MHVVLTGATGLIGSAVVPQLVERGDRVTALVRSEEAAAKAQAAGATAAVVDFGDVMAIAEAFRPADAVIHLAAAGDDAEAFDRRVAEAAVGALGGTGKPYVHTGGVWVYGPGDDLTEETPYDAPAITAWRLGVIESLEAEDLALTVLHPGIVYGDGGSGIPQVLAGQPRTDDGALTTLGSGVQHWTTIHVDDLAALYVAVVSSGTGHDATLYIPAPAHPGETGFFADANHGELWVGSRGAKGASEAATRNSSGCEAGAWNWATGAGESSRQELHTRWRRRKHSPSPDHFFDADQTQQSRNTIELSPLYPCGIVPSTSLFVRGNGAAWRICQQGRRLRCLLSRPAGLSTRHPQVAIAPTLPSTSLILGRPRLLLQQGDKVVYLRSTGCPSTYRSGCTRATYTGFICSTWR